VSAKKSKLSFETDRVDADDLPLDEADHAFNQTGRVIFDDRGNAIWEWAMDPGAHDDASGAPLRILEHPSLSIAEDSPSVVDSVRGNGQVAKKGYDPYDSDKPRKPNAPSRKKDLRRLSEWLKLKKQAEENKKNEDDGQD